jgi:hypothetical protein
VDQRTSAFLVHLVDHHADLAREVHVAERVFVEQLGRDALELERGFDAQRVAEGMRAEDGLYCGPPKAVARNSAFLA